MYLHLFSRTTFEISQECILEGIDDKLPPRGIRLEGPPGAGKTTYLRNIVHTWSTKFLEWSQDPSSQTVMPKWTLMVYIPARTIRGNIHQAIHDHLWCAEKDKKGLMKHMEEGEVVAVIIDAIDEICDYDVLKNLKETVHNWQTTRGPTFLISARNDLCSVDPADFNRFLILEGFTIDQGEEYVKKYFSFGQTSTAGHSVIEYVTRHKCKLESILCNPLKLHVFCALASEGILQLNSHSIFDVLTLFEALEHFLIKREGGPVSQEQSNDFYRLCLYCLLQGFREIPGKLLKQFNIVENYYAFLVQETTRSLNASSVTKFSFHHEMIYEFFAARCVETLPLQDLKALLLLICCKRSLWNVQKLIVEIILKKNLHNCTEILLTMVRCVLILQVSMEKKTNQRVISELLDLPAKIGALVSVKQLLLSRPSADQIKEVNTVWDKINRAFDVDAKELRAVSWFTHVEKVDVLHHVADCLRVCSSEQREMIIRNSVYCLLPNRNFTSE